MRRVSCLLIGILLIASCGDDSSEFPTGTFQHESGMKIAVEFDEEGKWRYYWHDWGWPVMTGTIGGIALTLGATGLLVLKWRMDPAPTSRMPLSMDVSFLALLWLTAVTGLLLLALRGTALMGSLLVIHLGVVVGLFLTLPYGKFIHAVFRYAALLQHARESLAEEG